MRSLSPGAAVIVAIALASGVGMALRPASGWEGKRLWTFSAAQAETYAPAIKSWNEAHPSREQVQSAVLSLPAMERRLLSGFLAGTPVPDMCEVEVAMSAKFFAGPLDAVGVTDLTDRLKAEGLLDQINGPSFAPWTNRGRIFGLPHDVHPVLLGYRADIVEAAGIDVSKIETWDDFVRAFSPLMKDENGDGYPDRYLLNMWETNSQSMEILLLQAGGQLFDEHLDPKLDSEINARVLCTIASWTGGPHRIAANAPNMNAEGNQMFLEGFVLCNMMPDWLAGAWMQDLQGLSGKVKLMPLPAWEPGGRRTSVLGGTMLCFPKAQPDFESNWEFAKRLYLSRELAEKLFRDGVTISPVKAHWNEPFYDEPVPFYSGQAVGRAFINAAPDVPPRTSSPYRPLALTLLTDATIRIKRHAEQSGNWDVAALMPFARKELAAAQETMVRKIRINKFAKLDGTEEPVP